MDGSAKLHWARGRRLLRAADPVLRRLVDAQPDLDPAAVFDGWGLGLWPSLLRQVIDQHISHHGAVAILDRLRRHYAGNLPGPAEFLAAESGLYTEVGLSRAKIRTLRAAAESTLRGDLTDTTLAGLSDDAARAELTALHGIGRFTADGVLILALRRPDVMPSADLQIRKAVAALWQENPQQENPLPSVRAVDARAEAWRPWRTLAAAYLYRGPAQA